MLEVEKSWPQTQLAKVSRGKKQGRNRILPISLLLVVLSLSSTGSTESAFIVEVEVDRPPREFLRGPRWVSLNSTGSQSRMVESATKLTLSQVPRHGSSWGKVGTG